FCAGSGTSSEAWRAAPTRNSKLRSRQLLVPCVSQGRQSAPGARASRSNARQAQLSAWQDPEHPASSGLPRCGLHDAPARRIKNSPPLGRPFSVICSVSCVFLPQDDPRCSSTVLVEKNAHVRAMTREGHGHKRSEVRAEILG
ncbi:unnamed protein product, partial [Prorocentrum cordatum]